MLFYPFSLIIVSTHPNLFDTLLVKFLFLPHSCSVIPQYQNLADPSTAAEYRQKLAEQKAAGGGVARCVDR